MAWWQATCEEFGVEYKSYGSFWECLASTHRFLDSLATDYQPSEDDDKHSGKVSKRPGPHANGGAAAGPPMREAASVIRAAGSTTAGCRIEGGGEAGLGPRT